MIFFFQKRRADTQWSIYYVTGSKDTFILTFVLCSSSSTPFMLLRKSQGPTIKADGPMPMRNTISITGCIEKPLKDRGFIVGQLEESLLSCFNLRLDLLVDINDTILDIWGMESVTFLILLWGRKSCCTMLKSIDFCSWLEFNWCRLKIFQKHKFWHLSYILKKIFKNYSVKDKPCQFSKMEYFLTSELP